MSGAVEGVEDWVGPFCEWIREVKPIVGNLCSPETGFNAGWRAARATPPARSYADAIEDAAKAVEALRREVPYDYNKHPCWETKRRAIAAIRLLSQGEKA